MHMSYILIRPELPGIISDTSNINYFNVLYIYIEGNKVTHLKVFGLFEYMCGREVFYRKVAW